MTHYDLVIVGAGSGNMIVNRRFADWSVAIVEDRFFGGTCLNVGCIPTKMFVLPADLAREAADGERLGVHTSYDGADWPAIRDRIFGRVDENSAGARDFRVGQDNVTVIDGSARFTGERRLVVTTADGEVELTADNVVLANGARAVLPDIEGLADLPGMHTSDTIMRLDDLPERLVVIGGGVIAAEFAHVFSALGSSVVQVHRGDRLLGRFDDVISKRFTEQAAWELRLGRQVTQASRGDAGIELVLDDDSVVAADVVLVATGRVSNADRLACELAGVEVNVSGIVVVDEQQRTTAPGVWALGDLSNHWQLKHVANHEARVVQHNLLHPDEPVSADHRFPPAGVFSHPQIATAGVTEDDARRAGTSYAVVVQEYADVAYGWALEDTGHCVKLIGDRDSGQLIGVHIIGPQATTLIQPLVQAMHLGTPVAGLARAQYWIHPALTEVVENALIALARGIGDGQRG